MRKLLLITVMSTLFMGIFNLNASAQKQSKIEKLYEHIAKNEREKYVKARERMDQKSADTYKREIDLADALEKLYYEPEFGAIEPYLQSSLAENKQNKGARVRLICKDAGLDYGNFVQKADSMIFNILENSKEQLQESRALLAMFEQYNYTIAPETYNAIIVLKEKVQFDDLKNQPNREKCETYFKDFDTKYNYPAVAKIYNDLLYKEVCANGTDSCMLGYFNNPILKNYYTTTKEARPYKTEVEKMYDVHLYQQIKKAKSPESLKTAINNYLTCPYLTGCPRNFTTQVEYTNDSIDLVILVTQVDSSAKLPLVKQFLQDHKYKQFRDRARHIREQFVDSMIWTSPTATKYYIGNNLVRELRNTNDTTADIRYSYNEHGYLLEIAEKIQVHDSTPSTRITTLKYNDLGKCFEEETIDSLTKNILCQVTYQYDIQGHISSKNTKWNNDRNRVENYNNEGLVARVQEYMNGQIYAQTDFTYDANGRLTRKVIVNLKPDINNPITKHTSDYTYNAYGYLTNVSYSKENLQNENITGNIAIHYDPYGNIIDPRCKYEYDITGAWITKTNPQNPNDSEKKQYVYK